MKWLIKYGSVKENRTEDSKLNYKDSFIIKYVHFVHSMKP